MSECKHDEDELIRDCTDSPAWAADCIKTHEAKIAELKAISENSKLSWQDRHIAAYKVLHPETSYE